MRYLIFFLIVFSLTGCYTLIEHPVIEIPDENEKLFSYKVIFYEDCSECHSANEIVEYNFLANMEVLSPHKLNEKKFYRIKEEGNFDFFYNSVWWFDLNFDMPYYDEN